MSLHSIVSLLLKCVAIVFVMLDHECGHLLAARYYGVAVRMVGCNWKGTYIQRARTTGWPEIHICLAGAAMNLALAPLCWPGCHWLGLCQLTFAWVNLLPIPHSDGTHALQALRAMRRSTGGAN